MTFQFSSSGQLEHIKVIFQHLCGDSVLREKRECHNNKTRKILSVLVAHITAGHRSLLTLPLHVCGITEQNLRLKAAISCDSNELRNLPHFM